MAERKVHPVKVNPETGEKTKVCSFCERELPISNFYINNGRYRSRCIECTKAIEGERLREKRKQKKENATVTVESESQNNTAPDRALIPVLGKYETKALIAELKKRQDFSLAQAFAPRELITALYKVGYRGELSILVEQKVQLRDLDA